MPAIKAPTIGTMTKAVRAVTFLLSISIRTARIMNIPVIKIKAWFSISPQSKKYLLKQK